MKSEKIRNIITAVFMLLLPFVCHAQFFVTGDDPGRLRWNSIETQHYRIIYPQGDDSLAFQYGRNLEKYRNSISRTTGYMTAGTWGKKMPVVMHTHNGENGSVAWAPSRMDLYTIPSPYSPEPLPWNKMLAIHESRHVSQMQFGMTKALKPFNWFFGEMFNILVSLFYPGISAMEGDAVIAETTYSVSGRGRTAEFLNYYRIALDEGITDRQYYKWRYGSQRYYVPNYYSLGYLTIGGMRVFYDCPDFMYRVYELSARRPYNLASYFTVIKDISGKNQKEAFKEVCDSMAVIWKAEADARAPYTPFRQVVKEPRLYMEYENPVATGKGVYVFRSGFEYSPALVRVGSDGKERFVKNVSSNTSNINFDEMGGKLWWSESTSSARWSLKSRSLLHSYDINTGKSRTFKPSNLLHNPSPSPDGKSVATAIYSHQGKTGIMILDSENGEFRKSVEAPDSLQVVEMVWKDKDTIYSSAVSDNGYGIYQVNLLEGTWSVVLAPQPVMVSNFSDEGNLLTFESDMDGQSELYQFDPETGKLTKRTSFRFGAKDYCYTPSGDSVVFVRPTVKGKILSASSSDSLRRDNVAFGMSYNYFLADSLTKQEKKYAESCSQEYISSSETSVSQPVRYRKALHALNLHSWTPFYVSVDKIMNMSFDKTYEAISLGAAGIMQNKLSTAVGEFGYSAHKDPYERSRWRHSAHARFSYTGLPIAFEGTVDFNDRAARMYGSTVTIVGNTGKISLDTRQAGTPSIQGKVSLYVPLSFNWGGWYRGFIPKLNYSISNDSFDSRSLVRRSGSETSPVKTTVSAGEIIKVTQAVSGSMRFYGCLSTPNSAVYPRWGGGIEVGASYNISFKGFFSPMAYGYVYGYFPGFTRTQGLKLTALHQQKLSRKAYFGQPVVNFLPRGFKNASGLSSFLASSGTMATKFTADYAIPIYVGEWPVFNNFIYVSRLVLTPHFDCMIAGKNALYSAGLTASLNLKTICWIEWPCSVGVTASYNGGFKDAFGKLSAVSGPSAGHYFVGPVFEVSF